MTPILPPPTYVFFELCSLAIAAVVLWHAFRTDRPLFYAILAFYPATYALEFINVRFEHGYYYTRFIWMLGSEPSWVPACVIAAWGSIFYGAVVTVRELPLHPLARPLVAGLLAVLLDLACDPVAASSRILSPVPELCTAATQHGDAYGIGFWVWCVPHDHAQIRFWFGIPLGNFIAWWAAIAAYMASIDLVYLVRERTRRLGSSLAAKPGGVIALWISFWVSVWVTFTLLFLGSMFAWRAAAGVVGEWPATCVVFAIPILLILRAVPRVVRSAPIRWVPLLPVLFTMPWSFAEYWLTGELRHSRAPLGAAIVACSIAAFYVYSLPYRIAVHPRGREPSSASPE